MMKRNRTVRYYRNKPFLSRSSMLIKKEHSPSKDDLGMIGNQNSEEVYLAEHSFVDEDENIEALEEEVDTFEEQTEEGTSGSVVPDLRMELASLVKKTNVSDAFTDNLLKLLRKNGHTDLPTSKTTLVSKPKPKPQLVQQTDTVLNTILNNQKTILKDQQLILEQLKAVERSDACLKMRILDLSAKVEKIKAVQATGDVSVANFTTPLFFFNFPCKSLDEFVKFDNNLSEEDFQTSILAQLDNLMSSSTWLFDVMNDDVLLQYNLNGNHQKRSLRNTNLLQLLKTRHFNHKFLEDQHIQSLVKQSHQRKLIARSRARKKIEEKQKRSELSHDDDSM